MCRMRSVMTRLTRAGTRKDQNRTIDLFDGRSLLGVELHRFLV